MMYGISQLGSAQYGGSYNASGIRAVTVAESLPIVESIQKSIRTNVREPLVLSEVIQKTIQSTVTTRITIEDLPRIFVNGNEVTHWRRTQKDTGSWSSINKQQ